MLLALGIGFFMLTNRAELLARGDGRPDGDRHRRHRDRRGLVVSTAMSYVLSKRMGLIERPRVKRDHDAAV